jgi:uracil-DNA glycosylase
LNPVDCLKRAVAGSLQLGLDERVVFLCPGQYAQKLLVRERIASDSTAAGTWEIRASQVFLPYPVAAGFIRGSIPFLAVNDKLVSMGAAPIDW